MGDDEAESNLERSLTAVDIISPVALDTPHDHSYGPPLSPEVEAMGLPEMLVHDLWMVWSLIDADHKNDISCSDLAQAHRAPYTLVTLV